MTLGLTDPPTTSPEQPDHPCPAPTRLGLAGPSVTPTGGGPYRDASVRATISLDGEWGFRFCGDAVITQESAAGPAWRACVVPGPWQAQFADLRERNGRALYRRRFDLPAGWVGAPLFLRFGAVSYHARVRVNGRVAVEHEGGYLPFEADIGGLVRPGENEISVEVTAPTDDAELYPEFPLSEIPFGKQSWYGPLGGIWQSVTLERRSADHVRAVQVLAGLADGRVEIAVALARPVPADRELTLEVEGVDGGVVVASRTVAVVVGGQLATTTLVVPDPRA